MGKKASIYDYIVLQGGRPNVWQDDNELWHIEHEYRDDCPKIVTHISPAERGTVTLGDGIIYEIALLWDFEGKPCEALSNKNGGYGYEREA